MFPDRKYVETIKETYPIGCTVELDYMDDPQAPPTGTKGEVEYVDDIGQIHVKWENGCGLALTKIDRFHKV